MDEIKLRYFISAARHLSFTKAAEDCHVTQSTISKQISALEDELKSPLFYRSHSMLTLTAAGERLAIKAEDYMEQYRMIEESVRRLHLEQDQRLTIGAGPWEWALVSKPLEIFLSRYPDVEVFCSHYTHKRITSHLRTGTIDVAICSNLCTDNVKELICTPLGDSQWEIIAHKNDSFWERPEKERQQLKEQVVVTFYENEYEPVRPYCLKNNMKIKCFAHSNFFPTFLAMIRAKAGVSLAPKFILPFLSADIISEPILNQPLTQRFYAVRNQKIHSNAAIQFMDICREVYTDAEELYNVVKNI